VTLTEAIHRAVMARLTHEVQAEPLWFDGWDVEPADLDYREALAGAA
jgi:hypothetical protein